MSAPALNPARWREVRDLFDEVVELGQAERAARLAAVGRGDSSLRRDVERLLEGDAEVDSRLASIESALGSAHPEALAQSAGSRDPLGLAGRTLSHFRVIEPLAVGGMGVVYRAEDTRLHRAVALKLPLPLQAVDARARERFLREARAAGALDHPNVCGIYEVGESEDGHLYLAMPLCLGETLKARVEREGSLPVPLALEIARAVARGLGAAHAAGIVHRDVKPGNVMLLPDGGVKVLDFGIASVRDLDPGASRATAGTIPYMAPEQLRGEPATARTDLWALGVVLYEMLTGRRPFDRAHDGAIAYAVMHEEPVRPLALRKELPRALDAVVRSLLQKDQERRPSTAETVDAELAAAALGRAPRHAWSATIAPRLRYGARRVLGPLAVGALTVGALAAALLLPQRGTRGRAAPLTAAARPTASAEAYDFYLRGREYERRARSRESLHGARLLYRRALASDSAFSLARARLAIVQVALLRAGYERGPSSLADARAAAEASLRSQPELGEGHLALGHVFAMEGRQDSALAAYERAADRMPENAEPHTAIALTLRAQGRWEDALTRFEHAARLDPRDAGLLQALARTQSRLRRYQAAIRTWDRILELAPDDYDARLIRGALYLRWHGVTDTLAAALRAMPPEWDPEGTATWARFNVARIERRPADAVAAVTASRHDASQDDVFFRPHTLLQAQAQSARGDHRRAVMQYERARAELEDSVAARPEDVRMHVALGLAYAGLGRRARAAESARHAMALVRAPAATPIGTAVMGDAAEILVRAGDLEGALALLARLIDMPAGREVSAALLRVDPLWDPLRGDERFERMLRELGATRGTVRPSAEPAPATRR